jgi:hypothetical protein
MGRHSTRPNENWYCLHVRRGHQSTQRCAELIVTGKATNVWTLEQAIQATYALRWAGTKSEKGHLVNAKILTDYFGKDMLISQMNNNKVDDFVLHMLENGKANATVNRKLSTLSVICKTALKKGYLEKMPNLDRRKEYQGAPLSLRRRGKSPA